MGVVGLAGILFFLAGSYLLWQARSEVLYWLAEFFMILRGEFRRREASGVETEARRRSESVAAASSPKLASGLSASLLRPAKADSGQTGPAAPAARRKIGTLRLVGGLGLIFLGQVLLFLEFVL